MSTPSSRCCSCHDSTRGGASPCCCPSALSPSSSRAIETCSPRNAASSCARTAPACWGTGASMTDRRCRSSPTFRPTRTIPGPRVVDRRCRQHPQPLHPRDDQCPFPRTTPICSSTTCLPAPVSSTRLARFEGAGILSELVEQVRTIELADQPEPKLNDIIRGFVRCPRR